MRTVHVPSRFAMPLLRCLLAMLALVSQLTLGSIDAPARTAAAGNATLRSAFILCGGGGQDRAQPAHPGHRHAQGDAAGQTVPLELPPSLLADAPILPPPVLASAVRISDPVRPRAPSARFTTLFRARAPPFLA